MDADSLLDPDALLHVVQPFLTDPDRVIATGGVVQLINGAEVVAGRVHNVSMPKRWLTRIQVVEYLRAFLLGRAGWSKLGSLLVVSGAFGLFRRDVLVSSVGWMPPPLAKTPSWWFGSIVACGKKGGLPHRVRD